MGLVDRDPRAVLLTERDDLVERGKITFHREHPVDHDELARFGWRLDEEAAQGLDVVVVEAMDVGVRQTAAVDDAGVVELVGEDHVPAAGQAADHTEIRLEAGREDQGRFLVTEVCELALELLVHGQRTVQESASGAARPPRSRGRLGGLDHPGVVGVAEVVVRPGHHQFVAVDVDRVRGRTRDGLEVRVQSGGMASRARVKWRVLSKTSTAARRGTVAECASGFMGIDPGVV